MRILTDKEIETVAYARTFSVKLQSYDGSITFDQLCTELRNIRDWKELQYKRQKDYYQENGS